MSTTLKVSTIKGVPDPRIGRELLAAVDLMRTYRLIKTNMVVVESSLRRAEADEDSIRRYAEETSRALRSPRVASLMEKVMAMAECDGDEPDRSAVAGTLTPPVPRKVLRGKHHGLN